MDPGRVDWRTSDEFIRGGLKERLEPDLAGRGRVTLPRPGPARGGLAPPESSPDGRASAGRSHQTPHAGETRYFVSETTQSD